MKRDVATFSITLARGRAELIPELPATVEGFKREIDNTDWILAKVRNSVSDSGFSFVLLGWAANARRRAMAIKPALPVQGDLFGGAA